LPKWIKCAAWREARDSLCAGARSNLFNLIVVNGNMLHTVKRDRERERERARERGVVFDDVLNCKAYITSMVDD
jgi:hypothetical protein